MHRYVDGLGAREHGFATSLGNVSMVAEDEHSAAVITRTPQPTRTLHNHFINVAIAELSDRSRAHLPFS
jgi:hypothetical protein